jgi:hypothetical protein
LRTVAVRRRGVLDATEAAIDARRPSGRRLSASSLPPLKKKNVRTLVRKRRVACAQRIIVSPPESRSSYCSSVT